VCPRRGGSVRVRRSVPEGSLRAECGRSRLKFLAAFLCVGFAGLWFRLFCLQTIECERYRGLAAGMHTTKVPIEAARGRIYDRKGEILALSVPGRSVFVSPVEISDAHAVARALAGPLGIDPKPLAQRVREHPESRFAWVKRLVAPREAAAVRSLRLEGVHLREEMQRCHPFGNLAAQVIGFTGVDEQGLSGVEFAYDETLSGRDGWRRAHRDARARHIANPALAFVPGEDGCSVVLTIDANIQDFLESALERCWNAHRPKAVTGIVLQPETGEVLALAQRPTFEPARYADYPEETWRLRAVTDSFEPGSMFKPFVFSAALEEGIVRLDETIFCENGAYRIGGRLLHDHHSYGNLSALEVVTKSSNIGMAKIGQRLGSARCYSYLSSFGVGRASGLGLPSEAPGHLAPPEQWSHYTLTSVPMGHEVSLNAVQMAAAFAVFANGGYLLQPRILRGVIAPDGSTLERHFDPLVKRRVLSAATARTMLRRVLREVVTNGTGRLANLEHYAVAGKTGTAQKLVDGVYSHNAYISSFICTAPVQDPRAVVLIVVDEPSAGPGRFGGSVAAPYAAEVLEATLDYIFVDTQGMAVELLYASADTRGGRGAADAP